MTKLSASAFIAKYTTIFADNGNREISAEDMRHFRQDIADSFWNQVDDPLTALDKLQVDTSGASITLDMDSKSERLFYGSASWATAKTLAVSNATNAVSFVFLFEITNTNGTLTLPSNFMCVDARMVGQVFTPLDIGRYKMRADFDGTNWWVDEFIGLYQT
jgi:hypothetical protein